jgi:hypothetical protein
MPSPSGNWKPFHLDHVVATTNTVYACPGIAGIIRQITFFAPVIASTGTLALSKNTLNILTATNIDLNAATGTTPAAQTLAASTAPLTITATDYLKAVWTISSAGSYAGGACTVWIEPFDW